MTLVAQYALGISEDGLISETARVFGLRYGSEGTKEVLREMLKRLVRERKLAVREGVVSTV